MHNLNAVRERSHIIAERGAPGGLTKGDGFWQGEGAPSMEGQDIVDVRQQNNENCGKSLNFYKSRFKIPVKFRDKKSAKIL